jgi:putative intracellular protease/amidase/quercetin dioxygenase-like cupin family protein
MGGEPPMDPASLVVVPTPDSDARFLADAEARGAIATTLPLAQVSPNDYDAVYYPGGHGVLWDLVEDEDSIRLLEGFLATGKPTALVCHAPAALCHVRTPAGAPAIFGRRVSGTSNSEERASGLHKFVPFMLEDQLTALAGRYSSAPDGEGHVVVDGNLITGQNPASALGVGLALIRGLGVAIPLPAGGSFAASLPGRHAVRGFASVLLPAGLSLLGATSALVHAAPSPPQIQREVVERSTISGTGRELVAYRVTVPPGAIAPSHCHPEVGIGYVIEGEFESRFAGGAMTHKRAGETFIDDAVSEHVYFRNVSKTAPVVFVIMYALRPGEPQIQTGQSCHAANDGAR